VKRKLVTKPVDLEKRARAMAREWYVAHFPGVDGELFSIEMASLTKLLLRFARVKEKA
jgi:hypothetical protein